MRILSNYLGSGKGKFLLLNLLLFYPEVILLLLSFTFLSWMSSAAKVKSFNLPFWSLCLKWIKESNKISFQTFNFPGLQALSLSHRSEGGFEPSVTSHETFPWAVAAVFLLLFIYRIKRNFKREGSPTPPKKDISWPHKYTALFTGLLVFLKGLAKKKLHLADNSHFSLNLQFKHDPEWKIAKQEAFKLHQSNVIRHGSKRPFMMLALQMRPTFYRRSLGLLWELAPLHWVTYILEIDVPMGGNPSSFGNAD